jgi:hypothetical protein
MKTLAEKGALKPTILRAAGMMAMVSAVMALPMFFFFLQLAGRHDEDIRTPQVLMQCVGSVIFIALASSLRYFLARNCYFRKADGIILWLIALNIVYAVASSVGLYLPQGEEQFQPVLAAIAIMLGIAQAGLGIRLLMLPYDLGGMKLPYCWLNIVTGICMATLLLIPVGIVISAVGDVMLATIFFREARRLSPSKGADLHA